MALLKRVKGTVASAPAHELCELHRVGAAPIRGAGSLICHNQDLSRN